MSSDCKGSRSVSLEGMTLPLSLHTFCEVVVCLTSRLDSMLPSPFLLRAPEKRVMNVGGLLSDDGPNCLDQAWK